jgi:endonuclease/exonuclease/phosphatase family metal-dependent hydrolase
LARWNADGIRGRKQELDHFLGQHGIDICLLNETHLRSHDVFRMANYVCHRNDRRTEGGGTAILVRRGIDHHAIPVQGLQYLEATAIQVTLANKPVKILAVYLSPTRPLIVSDLAACLGGGLPVLMAGDLNAKHVDWNSRLITTRGRLLRAYADKNSCLIHGPNTPTTVPYNPSSPPDVLDIAITRGLHSPVFMTTCSALSSDHLPVLIDTQCRSTFLNPPDRPDFRTTDWATFQASLENGLPSTPDFLNEVAIVSCVTELSSAISKALTESTPKSRPRADPRPPLPAHIKDEIRLKNRLRRQWQITRDPALKAEANRLQRSVTSKLNEWRNDQWSNTLESLDPEDQSLWKMTKRVMRIPTPSPPLVTPGGLALSDSEKAEALADSLEAQFQPVSDPSVPAVVEVVNGGDASIRFAPAREPKLTNPMEVQDAIRGLKVGKAPRPDGIPNKALKHLPLSVVSLLVVLLNAIL